MSDPDLRRLVRDQWVRTHGTPRVTVLAGGLRARELWQQWAAVMGIDATLLERDLEPDLREALARAEATPAHPIAVRAARADIRAWREGRTDRLAALLDEGLLVIDDPPAAGAPRSASAPGGETGAAVPTPALDARSVAEATLYEALEATPATAGRFELNGLLSVRFGPGAAEVDLLARRDAIAIEIDGYHHFTDMDRYRRDRRKDLLLQTQGLLVIRLLATDVMRDVRAAVMVVCEGMAYREQRGRT